MRRLAALTARDWLVVAALELATAILLAFQQQVVLAGVFGLNSVLSQWLAVRSRGGKVLR